MIWVKTGIRVPTQGKNMSLDAYPAINPNSLFWKGNVAFDFFNLKF